MAGDLLCILLLSTGCKNHVITYCTTVYERNIKNVFWSIKISGEILNKLKSKGFLASNLSNMISLLSKIRCLKIEKLMELIEHNFIREGFFSSEQSNDIRCG